MEIGGLQKLSLIDYPKMICAVVFLRGCNFRCAYCHNPELVDKKLYSPLIPENEVFEFLDLRKGKLDAVTISGGEPSLQNDLFPFIKKIKNMGFAVKFDTNGSRPDVIRSLIDEGLINFIAMDVKAPWNRYKEIIRGKVELKKIEDSIRYIIDSGISHEFRTTLIKSQLTEKDIFDIADKISGAQRYVLQRFVAHKTLRHSFSKEQTFSADELKVIKKRLEKEISSVIVR